MSTCPECFTVRSAAGACLCGVVGVSITPEPPVVVPTLRLVHLDGAEPLMGLRSVDDLSHGHRPADKWTRRYASHLERIPELLMLCRSAAVALKSQQFDRVLVDESREAPLPFRVDAVDDADLLWALLVLYGREVAELLGGSSPAVLRSQSWSTTDVQGVRSAASAEATFGHASEVVRWLVQRAESIGPLTELEDSEEHLFAFVRVLSRQYRLEERPDRSGLRRCPICGERAVAVTFAQVAGREASLVRCTVCGNDRFEEVAHGADVLASRAEGAALGRDDQTVAS